jgi:Dolichyl-phosphate-mannose-protein mannosyltransferase
MRGPSSLRRPHAFAVATSLRRQLLAVLLICAAAGAVSVALGPDDNWDLLYYHLYAPYAYLHGRYLYDIGPAQSQGFFNPVADFLFYGLISSVLNDTPRVVAFVMGAVHGINAVLVLAIAVQVLRPAAAWERRTLRGAAFLMGISGAGFVSLLGTTTNDLINSIFVLGSLLCLLRVAAPAGEGDVRRGLAWAGLWAGIGVGLKYTAAIYLPGLALIALTAAWRRRSIGGATAFAAAALLGFLAVAGHHLLTLWHDFGSPVFPWLNDIFRSPWYEPQAIRDMRFLPRDAGQLIAYPFYWAKTNAYLVTEMPFRDWRCAIAYVAIAAVLPALAAARAFNRLRGASADVRGLGLVVLFVVVSFICWELVFGIYRYAAVLEMLTGVVTMGALIRLIGDARVRVAAGIAVLALAAATTVYFDWGRGDYDDRYVDVRVPPLPPHSVVLIATWQPVAYFIPFAEPSARFVGIENNYLELSQTNRLAMEVKRIMRAPGPPKFVLNVGAFEREKTDGLLAHFGLKLSARPCEPVESNLATADDEALSLCPLGE